MLRVYKSAVSQLFPRFLPFSFWESQLTVSSMNSTRTWVTPPREPAKSNMQRQPLYPRLRACALMHIRRKRLTGAAEHAGDLDELDGDLSGIHDVRWRWRGREKSRCRKGRRPEAGAGVAVAVVGVWMWSGNICESAAAQSWHAPIRRQRCSTRRRPEARAGEHAITHTARGAARQRSSAKAALGGPRSAI